MDAAVDHTANISLDSATIFLFNPLDLAHRDQSPAGWWNFRFACLPEFEAGRLIAFSTRSDGTFRVRVTTQPLSSREKRFARCSCDFRLAVKHGHLLIDNDLCIPHLHSRTLPAPEDMRWIPVPNGNYCATVYAIAWDKERGAVDAAERATSRALPSYIILLRTVADLADLPVFSTTPPDVEVDSIPSAGAEGESSEAFVDVQYPIRDPEDYEPREIRETDHFVLMRTAQWLPLPNRGTYLAVSKHEYNLAFPDALSSEREIEHWVLASPGCASGGLGVLTGGAGGSERSEGSHVTYELCFNGQQLIRILEIFDEDGCEKVRAEKFVRQPDAPSDDELLTLKQAFVKYATTNQEFRSAHESPDFEAEHVAHMPSANEVTNCILYFVRMPDELRERLVVLSDADRTRELTAFLRQSNSSS